MKTYVFYKCLTVAFLYAVLLSCSRREYAYVTPQGDTVPLSATLGKIKARTVTIQVGTGNTASAADNTKAGQRSGSAATAPGASAAATTKRSGSPWLLYLGLVLSGAVGWEYLRSVSWLRWLPKRSAPA